MGQAEEREDDDSRELSGAGGGVGKRPRTSQTTAL